MDRGTGEAVVGIEFGERDCKVAFSLDPSKCWSDNIADEITGSLPEINSRPQWFTFSTDGLFHGVNLNIFKDLVGKGSFSSEEFFKEEFCMNPFVALFRIGRSTGVAGLKLASGINLDEVFVPGIYFLAILFRKILNTVFEFSALRNSTKDINMAQTVIIVPIFIDEHQQQAIIQAASLAGFVRVGLLRDITTACSTYRRFYPSPQVNIDNEDHTLFINIGQSSSRAFVVSNDRQIVCTEYNHDFGVRDIDIALAKHFGEIIYTTYNFNILSIPQARFSLFQQCSKARKEILYSKEVVIELLLPAYGLEYRTCLTLDILQSITPSCRSAIFTTIQRVLDDSELTHLSIRTVVLYGEDISIYKSHIMDKFPRAICRSLESFWMAKSALKDCNTILGSSTPRFWIGRHSGNSNVICRPIPENNSENGHGSNLETITESLNEIKLSEGDQLHGKVLNRGTNSGVKSFVLNTTGDISQIDNDIVNLLAVLENLKEGDPERPNQCNNLCGQYMMKYTSTKDIFALNHALLWGTRALENVDYRSPEAKPEHISNVATCLNYLYERTKDLQTLNMAILYQSYIVDKLPADDDDPANGGFLTNYGVLLQTRGQHLGDSDDLVKAGKHFQRAIGLLASSTNPQDLPRLIAALENLGNTLQLLYNETGTLDDLYRTIQCFEIALSLLPTKDAERSVALNGMGKAMMTHFHHFGDMESVEKAARCFQEALEYVSENNPSRKLYLSGYANAADAMYGHSKDINFINQAIETQKKIVELSKDDGPSNANFIDKLGILYSNRFKETGDRDDLDEAIRCHESALLLTNSDQLHQKSILLNNLGNTLQTQFLHTKLIEDSIRSISTLEMALEYTSYGSSRAGITYNLAQAYLACYKEERVESQRRKCIELCREVVTSLAPLTVRFHAAGLWTEAALFSTNGPETLDATTTMMNLLSQLAWPGLSLSSQIEVLRFANEAACNAAAIALHFKDTSRALAWLEQGRTVTWNQLLHIRSPLADLRSQDSELAEKIIELSQQLDRGEVKSHGTQIDFVTGNIALERDKLLQKARNIPGFENLMIEKDFADFSVGSFDGPIVVVNISRYRCDALILLLGHLPVNLPLDTFSLQLAEDLKTAMLTTLKASTKLQRHAETEMQSDLTDDDDRYGRRRKTRLTEDSIDANFRYILKELWNHIVEPIIRYLAYGVELDEDLPHIWWCPTGPLTFLPLHAAGIYGSNDDHETARISLMDYAVSSYIPNIFALHNNMHNRGERPPFKLLSVIQPNTPGQQPLPATLREQEIIEKCAKKGGFSEDIEVLQGEQATSEAVIEGMKKHSWIHLACHGEQNVHQPTKSGLILHDSSLLFEEIVKISLPNADFAFLSACQTASGDVSHPDEAVHLAAGMLMAGYRSVIASMWSIGDNDASMVAEDVYGYLFEEGKVPDSRMAVRALHRAVRNLRVRHAGPHGGTKFLAWLPFIHVGV